MRGALVRGPELLRGLAVSEVWGGGFSPLVAAANALICMREGGLLPLRVSGRLQNAMKSRDWTLHRQCTNELQTQNSSILLT